MMCLAFCVVCAMQQKSLFSALSVPKIYRGQWMSSAVSHNWEAVSQEHKAFMERTCEDLAVKY
jgi:hypothetical protein